MKKYTKAIVGGVVALLITITIALNYAVKDILPYSPIRPTRVVSNKTPSVFTSKWQQFNITVEDSIRLKGWFVKSDSQYSKGTVILLHGIGSNKAAMLPIANILSNNGFNSILFDLRANGESGGVNCTFGYYEKYDVSSYIDSAIVRYPGSGPFGILGHSLGAAVAVQSLAIDKRLVCGVIESPFAKLRDIIHDYFARMFFIRLDFIPDIALSYSERIANFKVDSVQPILSAREIEQPVMVVHGLLDKNISPLYGKEIFDSVKSINKEWVPITNAGHNDLSLIGGSQLDQKIVSFFNRYLK